jgi:ubiquitin C-terminal hydrolase
MDTPSPTTTTPREDRTSKMMRELEKAINGKNVLDLSKTFSKKKWDKLKKKNTDNPEPLLSRRDVDKQPCGLYNAGNFCYLNSFLQTWYNDLVFRQCM